MWDFGCFNPNHDCTNLSASKQGFGKHPVHLGLRPSPCNGSSAVVNSPMNYLMNTCNIPIIPIRHSYNAKKFSLQIHITFSDIWLLDPKASDSHFAGQTPMLVGKKWWSPFFSSQIPFLEEINVLSTGFRPYSPTRRTWRRRCSWILRTPRSVSSCSSCATSCARSAARRGRRSAKRRGFGTSSRGRRSTTWRSPSRSWGKWRGRSWGMGWDGWMRRLLNVSDILYIFIGNGDEWDEECWFVR